MDLGSPDKRVEDCKEEDGASVAEKLDLNMFDSKDETVNEAMNSKLQVYSYQKHSGLPVAVDDEELQSSIIKSNSPSPLPRSKISEETCFPIELDLNSDDVNKRTSCHNNEGLRSPLDTCCTHNEKEGTYYVGLSNELLDSSADGTFNNKVEAEHLDPSINYPLLEIDDKQAREVGNDDNFDNESAKFLSSNAPVNGVSGNISGNSYFEKDEFVKEEMDGRNSSDHTEMNEDCYPTRMVPSDYGRIEGENYSIHSPHRDQNATPSPERQQLSVSPERSPRTQHSARQEERPSPANSDREKAPSPSISKRKRSPSPEKRSVGRKRASSRDGLSSDRRRSPSDRTAQRDSHHKDDSPRKRSTASPRRRESPRRRNRSLSRSPVRRGSSGHRREHRGRSRSRSPYSRDRYRRSSRRRHSPRHRSPPSGYHSRHRSPRRPWSPPANRNTGVGRPGNNLFVAGFSYVTTERDLEKKFSRFGRVTDVRIVRDKRTGDSRGFGFLSLERDEDADAAIRAVDQTEWNGRIVLVEKSKTSLR